MPPDLGRFIEAQESVYGRVLEELGSGRKLSHWMWFVFPQLAGLGSSEKSQRYAIHSLDEARAYLAIPCSALACGSVLVCSWPRALTAPRRSSAESTHESSARA